MRKTDPKPTKAWSVPYEIAAMLTGCVMVYSFLFTTGSVIYGNYNQAGVLGLLGLLMLYILIKLWNKIRELRQVSS
jgi:hypothetical protein